MLDSVERAEVLRGVRGGKGVDRAALADIICRVSKLVNDFPEIQRSRFESDFCNGEGRQGRGRPHRYRREPQKRGSASVRAKFSRRCSGS